MMLRSPTAVVMENCRLDPDKDATLDVAIRSSLQTVASSLEGDRFLAAWTGENGATHLDGGYLVKNFRKRFRNEAGSLLSVRAFRSKRRERRAQAATA